MKPIVTIKYKCEVCGSEYNDVRHALVCESQEIDPCPVKIGDIVNVINRYETVQDEVVDVFISAAEAFAAYLDQYKKNGPVPIGLLECDFHEWHVKTKKYHSLFENGYPEYNSFPISNLEIEPEFRNKAKKKLKISDFYDDEHIKATEEFQKSKKPRDWEKFVSDNYPVLAKKLFNKE